MRVCATGRHGDADTFLPGSAYPYKYGVYLALDIRQSVMVCVCKGSLGLREIVPPRNEGGTNFVIGDRSGRNESTRNGDCLF